MAPEGGARVFDARLAASLYPQLVALLAHATASSAPTSDASTTNSNNADRQSIGREATKVRTTLATLKAQAERIEGGQLGLDDQDWLIAELEKALEAKQSEATDLAELLELEYSGPPGPQKVEKEEEDRAEEMEISD